MFVIWFGIAGGAGLAVFLYGWFAQVGPMSRREVLSRVAGLALVAVALATAVVALPREGPREAPREAPTGYCFADDT